MKNISTIDFKKLIIFISLIFFGILLCFSIPIGVDGVSVISGLILSILGTFLIIKVIVKGIGLLSFKGLSSITIFTLGIVFIVDNLANILVLFIPWFLIILGISFIIDTLILKFYKNDILNFDFIVKLVMGSILLLLGFLLIIIDGFIEYSLVAFGSFLILYSIYLLIKYFIDNKYNKSNI